MKYIKESTLLPLSSQELRCIPRVPWCQHQGADLIVYDCEVSHFWFEFEPEAEIERFLQHGHFGTRASGGLLACREDLYQVASFSLEDMGIGKVSELVIPAEGELPPPLRFNPYQEALQAVQSAGHWKGRITCCSCGIPGCGAQYAWIERGLCLFLFTVGAASLQAVEFLPFRVASGRRG